MRDIPFSEFYSYFEEAQQALKYAEAHLNELTKKEKKYTLYGSYQDDVGVYRPGVGSPQIKRELNIKTRKKKYTAYMLDDDYNLLRVIICVDGEIVKVLLRVDIGERTYFPEFIKDANRNVVNPGNVYMVQKGDHAFPSAFVNINQFNLWAAYYDPISEDRMEVTYYEFYDGRKYTVKIPGYTFDLNAKIGEPNCQARRKCKEEDIVYTDFKKVCKKLFQGEEADESETDEVKMPEKTIASWIDELLENEIPAEVEGFCFLLYDHCDDESWDMELLGTERFDLEDSDWICDEVMEFEPRNNPYEWEMESTWDKVLEYVVREVKEYLETGKYADVLKSRKGVGVGFSDGTPEIVYVKED